MKRIQLFELEDFAWFPSFLRDYMTRYILVVHEMIGTTEKLAPILQDLIEKTNAELIQDTCSGAGGPMLDVYQRLERQKDVRLQLSDLYPHAGAIEALEKEPKKGLSYNQESVDVLQHEFQPNSIQTMICSFHHFSPEEAKKILKRAVDERRPICIFEISDNEAPTWLWWTAMLPAWIMTYFLTLKIRPLSSVQLFFTYCIQILPLCIAWDGAVSNARTYTEADLKELIADLKENYCWEIQKIKNKTPSKMLCLTGMPI